MTHTPHRALPALVLAALFAPPSPAQPPAPAPAPDGTLPADVSAQFKWRCVGPANMGGRIVALAVNEADPTTYWVATASGGLLKTSNNGTTFEHQFDREATVSIGDVAVSRSHPNVLYLGTGENNPRNSVSYGDGVYKSTDGGKTWANVGLRKSYQTGKVVIHPKNPDVAYVGALGRLYGANGRAGRSQNRGRRQDVEPRPLRGRPHRRDRPSHGPDRPGRADRGVLGAEAGRVRPLPGQPAAGAGQLRPGRHARPR